jgi:drug/metabolite transporter (DMT)-like permease
VRTTPYLLVLLATVFHAYWNYLLKRAGGGQVFTGLTKIAEVVLFAPVFLLVGGHEAATHGAQLWPLAVVGATLTLSNYVMLANAYERADLSFVYPISRGAILLFVPLLGYLVFGERLDMIGISAVVLILAGIVVMQLASLEWRAVRQLGSQIARSTATLFALAASAAAAGYTIWDKRSVNIVSPFTYFYTYTVLVGAGYGAYLVRAYGADVIRAELARNRWPIAQVAFLNTITYVLVLFALRDGVSSYVVAIRQLSIAFSALLGWRLLGERIGGAKRAGIALIVGGTLLVALAR